MINFFFHYLQKERILIQNSCLKVTMIQKKGVSILITDHSAQNVLSIVDRCSIISGGEIIISGKPKEIVNNNKARQLYFGENFNI